MSPSQTKFTGQRFNAAFCCEVKVNVEDQPLSLHPTL